MWMQDCLDCPLTQTDLQAWIRHLTDVHALPTEWPSQRAARLTGPTTAKPYTTITESKKRRRKDSVPRPLNSFMLFAQHIRRNVLRVHNEASNSVLSQQLGLAWKTVPRHIKNRYDDEAAKLVRIHQLEFPNYKYQPKKRVGPGECVISGHSTASDNTACPAQKLPILRGYSPEPWQQRCVPFDSAYSSRKNSCASSSASSPQMNEFPSSTRLQPLKRAIFNEHRPHIRQRFASATNGSMATYYDTMIHPQQRPASCLFSPAARVIKREYEFQQSPQTAMFHASICDSLSTEHSPISFTNVESSALSLPELVCTPSEVTLLGERLWQRGDDAREDVSYFESATESESILSEENGIFEDSTSLMDLADFLPGAEELLLGVEPLASVTLTPDLDMIGKDELIII